MRYRNLNDVGGKTAFGIMAATIRQCPAGKGSLMKTVLPEPQLCRDMAEQARKLNLNMDVYVFALDDYDSSTQTLLGYRPEHSGWRRSSVPLPDIIYDRCFFTRPADRQRYRTALAELGEAKRYQLLNGRLPSKLQVYNALRSCSALKRCLPRTIVYRSAQQLLEISDYYTDGVIAKPAAGMQGRGVLHIYREKQNHSIHIQGRSLRNHSFLLELQSASQLERWLRRATANRSYLIQPCLKLTGNDGRPFDVRALWQKDGNGRWRSSGTAVRCGQAGSITSNLHGGGDAESAQSALSSKFGKLESERLLEQIHTICWQSAIRLEEQFGRFAELAFDFGIEPDGKVWLLEVNSKPGRTAFRLAEDKAAQIHSIERPLLYAQYLTRIIRIRPFNVQEVHR